MQSRRQLLAVLGGAPFLRLLAADEVWNKKAAAEWSPQEIERILTRSPWARETTPEFNMQGMGMGGPPGGMGGPPGGGMGGPPGGGMGGPPGGGMGGPPPGGGMGGPGMGGGMPQFKAMVRWESAAPIREAAKTALPEGLEERYVLSITGLPMMGGGGPRGRDRDREDSGDMRNRRGQALESMKENAKLLRKGKEPLLAEQIRELGDGGGLLVVFNPGNAPITAKDKDVTFATRMGPLDLKVKFPLRDMMYRGQLEL